MASLLYIIYPQCWAFQAGGRPFYCPRYLQKPFASGLEESYHPLHTTRSLYACLYPIFTLHLPKICTFLLLDSIGNCDHKCVLGNFRVSPRIMWCACSSLSSLCPKQLLHCGWKKKITSKIYFYIYNTWNRLESIFQLWLHEQIRYVLQPTMVMLNYTLVWHYTKEKSVVSFYALYCNVFIEHILKVRSDDKLISNVKIVLII